MLTVHDTFNQGEEALVAAAGPAALTVRMQRRMNTGAQLVVPFSYGQDPIPGNGATRFRVSLPNSINLIRIVLPRCAQICPLGDSRSFPVGNEY